MAVITDELKLCVRGKSTIKWIRAKQGDQNSRLIHVELDDQCGELTIGDNDTAKIRALLPDNSKVVEDATINDDKTITAELTQRILAKTGVVSAEIVVYGEEAEHILSTEVFCILVMEQT